MVIVFTPVRFSPTAGTSPPGELNRLGDVTLRNAAAMVAVSMASVVDPVAQLAAPMVAVADHAAEGLAGTIAQVGHCPVVFTAVSGNAAAGPARE